MLERKVIVIGSDHAGYKLKEKLINWFRTSGRNDISVVDCGCEDDRGGKDYPEYAKVVSEAILSGEASHGILICGTGVGMCMAANRFRGIRAVLSNDVGIVKLSREHNNANVLCLAGRIQPSEHQLFELIKTFLNTEYTHHGRHNRRISMMDSAQPQPLAPTQDVLTALAGQPDPEAVDQDQQ